MNWRKYTGKIIIVGLLVGCSYCFLDRGIALFIKRALLSNAKYSMFASTIPDFLPAIVCVITGIAWSAYGYHALKGIRNKHTWFFLLIASAIPLAYFLKSILKIVVGRLNTRSWLLYYPSIKEFRWFHGSGQYSGFPSGHMVVFSVLAVALWKFYPRYRLAYGGFLTLLALALIATSYHFLSDVIAGAYLGLFVYYFTRRSLKRLPNFLKRLSTLAVYDKNFREDWLTLFR